MNAKERRFAFRVKQQTGDPQEEKEGDEIHHSMGAKETSDPGNAFVELIS